MNEAGYEWHVIGHAQTNEDGQILWTMCGDAVQEDPKVRGLYLFDRTFISHDAAMSYMRGKVDELGWHDHVREQLDNELNARGSITWSNVTIYISKKPI